MSNDIKLMKSKFPAVTLINEKWFIKEEYTIHITELRDNDRDIYRILYCERWNNTKVKDSKSEVFETEEKATEYFEELMQGAKS